MSHTKRKEKRPTQNLGPIDAELHRLLKMRASSESKTIRQLLEDALAPLVGWQPPGQLSLAGVNA